MIDTPPPSAESRPTVIAVPAIVRIATIGAFAAGNLAGGVDDVVPAPLVTVPLIVLRAGVGLILSLADEHRRVEILAAGTLAGVWVGLGTGRSLQSVSVDRAGIVLLRQGRACSYDRAEITDTVVPPKRLALRAQGRVLADEPLELDRDRLVAARRADGYPAVVMKP